MKRREFLASGIGAMSATMAQGTVSARHSARRSPNFIIIHCDDLGYGDIGPMGGQVIPTPHLDRMAQEGMTLTDYYAPANVCTPSRAGLLTGRYAIRSGMTDVLNTDDTRIMPLSEVTIAQALKPNYTSALIGKWHLGYNNPEWAPTNYGFDLFFGLPYSHDILPLKIYEFEGSRQTGEWQPDYPMLQQHFYERAERFIEAQGDQPFFLNLALSSPHLPNYPAQGFEHGSQHAGAYGDTVMEIDSIVGRLFEKLKDLELDQDTMVIFTSDNGPWFEGSTGGLRQRKGGAGYDGGYRVPFIARWPGQVPANRRSTALAMGIDLMPTFCEIAGAALPQDVVIDGQDISRILLQDGASPHDQLVLFQGEEVVGIRTQNWKYVNSAMYMNYFMRLDGRGYPQLYDMTHIGEQYSVASLHPDIVQIMQARLAQAMQQFEPFQTSQGPLEIQRERSRTQTRHVPEQWRSD